MIKKIQQYLLLHFPTIWNIKLVPVLLILLCAHIIFAGIGYIATDNTFGDSYYYSPMDGLGLAYFASILIGILILIGWVIFYNRNNAFKTFYPRKTSHLYLEWGLVFIITIFITFLPITLTIGGIAKWRSADSYRGAKEAIELLEKVKIIIPSDESQYLYQSEYHTPISIPSGAAIRIDTLNLDLYSFDYNKEGNIVMKGYNGPSLLFYRDYRYDIGNDYYYYDYNNISIEDQKKYVEQIEQVKHWLKDGDKDKIYGLMADYIQLQEKHNISTNIDPNTWFQRIYNPPYFPVNEKTMIGTDEYSTRYNHKYEEISTPYLEYTKLDNGYRQIIKSYEENKDIRYMSLICISIAIWISMFIYSFRVTDGKSWLIGIISSGVLIFISCLFGAGISELSYNGGYTFGIFFCTFWIVLFMSLLITIILKISDQKSKGYSNIFMNIFMWLLPCISPLLYFGYYYCLVNDRFNNIEDNIEIMFWINIPITISLIGLATLLIHKWKSIPEE